MDEKHPQWKEILLQQQQKYMQLLKFWQSPGAREPAGIFDRPPFIRLI